VSDDAEPAAAAAAAGLVAMGEMPAMMLQRRLADAVPPPGVDLRQVTTADDVADYGRVMSAAYATQQMPTDVMPTLLSQLQTLRAPHIVAFVARLDGTPVAGAMTVVTHRVAGIYWVGTTPEARGRGLAELCTRAAGNAGFDLGGRVASGVADGRGGLPPHGLRRGHTLSVSGAVSAAASGGLSLNQGAADMTHYAGFWLARLGRLR
jgi:Acetyltransferase (GNAT) domain